MHLWKFCGAALVCAAAAFAQNPTGKWQGPANPQVDEARQIVVGLNQQGDKVTGWVQTPNGADNFAEITLANGEYTLSYERTFGGQARKVTYTATIQGEKMTLSQAGGRGPARKYELDRVSKVAPAPLPAAKPLLELGDYKPVKANGLALTPPMGWNSWNKFGTRDRRQDGSRNRRRHGHQRHARRRLHLRQHRRRLGRPSRDANGNISPTRSSPT